MDDHGPSAPRARFSTTKVEVEGREETKIVELPSVEPPPWGQTTELTVVGQPLLRADALEKVTGQARYTADVQLPGMLHAVFVRAPIARGRVSRLDLTRSLALPGVRDALLSTDVPEITLDGVRLFDQALHYAGQPLAAICADSLEQARRALSAVVLETEAEHPVLTAAAALAPHAPRVKPNGNSPRNSPRVTRRGDVDAALAAAEVTITREYRTPVALHTALEPHGAVAEWMGDQVTIWESIQGIFMTRSDLATALDMPLSRVRVLTNYMGGGFGSKNGASHATYTAALLSRKVGRPVRCILDREGEQTDAGNRPATVQRVTLGARRDGTLTAIDLQAVIPLGIGGWQSNTAKVYHEMYRCPNVRSSETFVYTNTAAMNSFRAPGNVEGAFALESAMDALARELDMDPLALRRANYVEHDQEKDRPYSSKQLSECYRIGAERFGWTEARARPAGAGRVRRGVGMASIVWGAGGGPPAYANIRLNGDGSVDVLTGSQDLGTGSRTILAQIAAEELGADVAHVRTVLGDTERLPYAPNSWGSITTASVGPAVRVAAVEARRTLFEAAASMLDVPADQLVASNSVVRPCAGGPSLTFAEICEKLGDVMISGHGSRGPNPDGTAISAFGAQFAEVEVDTETGRVRVLRIVAVHDSGRIINPALAESQLQGGIIQGLGYALVEERVLDQRVGLSMNPTMHDYKIPTMSDIPHIDAVCVNVADPIANHTGAKGLAEPPIIGVAAAIANAVAHALGVGMPEIPLTPWRVLSALSPPT